MTAPTPHEIDQAAKKYAELKEQTLQQKLAYSDCQQQLETQAELLRDLVGKFGGAHAEKSKLLHGLKFEVLCTYGQEVKIDAAKVENFRLALVEAKQPRLLTRIFEKTIRWTLKPQASQIIRSDNFPEEYRALFADCEVITAKTPALKVREKSA